MAWAEKRSGHLTVSGALANAHTDLVEWLIDDFTGTRTVTTEFYAHYVIVMSGMLVEHLAEVLSTIAEDDRQRIAERVTGTTRGEAPRVVSQALDVLEVLAEELGPEVLRRVPDLRRVAGARLLWESGLQDMDELNAAVNRCPNLEMRLTTKWSDEIQTVVVAAIDITFPSPGVLQPRSQ